MNPEIFSGIQRMLESEPTAGRKLLDASCATGEAIVAYRKLGRMLPANLSPGRVKNGRLTGKNRRRRL